MTFSLKGLKTITNNQYEPACGILSLLDICLRMQQKQYYRRDTLAHGTSEFLSPRSCKNRRHEQLRQQKTLPPALIHLSHALSIFQKRNQLTLSIA